MPTPELLAHGSVQYEVAQNVGWDQRRLAASAHQQFALFHEDRPALELSWYHPPGELPFGVQRINSTPCFKS